jgi:hypothetical protein
LPKKLHQKLARQAKKQGLTGERKNAYVFGTMAKVEKKRRKK